MTHGIYRNIQLNTKESIFTRRKEIRNDHDEHACDDNEHDNRKWEIHEFDLLNFLPPQKIWIHSKT